MANKLLKNIAMLIPKVRRIYSEVDYLQSENRKLRSVLKSLDLYCIVGEVFTLKDAEIEDDFLNSLHLDLYEKSELELAKKFIRENDTVLDLGCGLGISTMVAARTSKTGRIVALEADPKMVGIATRNANLNKLNVEVRNNAIAKNHGSIDFFLADNFQYNSKFQGDGMRKIEIEAVAFQSIVNEIMPNVVTCDVEGVENELFEGVEMPSVRCVIVEIHPDIIGKEGISKCINDLKKSGLTYLDKESSGSVMTFLRMN